MITRFNPENLLKRFISVSANHPGWMIVITGLLTLPLLFSTIRLQVDNSLDIWYDGSDSLYMNYSDFKDRFGTDESLIVIYRNDSLFSAEQLELNKQLSEELGLLPGIASVKSLSTVRVPRLRGLRLFTAPVLPTQTSDYQRLKDRIISKPIFVNNLVSADGTATGILLYLQDSIVGSKASILQDIERTLHLESYASNSYFLVGNIPLIEENNRISGVESVIFILVCLLWIFLLLLIHLRHLYLALLPILIALINVIWTLGIYGLSGNSMNMIAAIVPIVILVISIALSVHVITRYQKYRFSISDKKEALLKALNSVVKPCLYTSITTFAAFLAFIRSDIVPVAHLGLFTAIGILISLMLSFTILPSILYYIRLTPSHEGLKLISWWKDLSMRLAKFTYTRRYPIIGFSILIFLLSVYGILQIGFESDQIKYFKKSNVVRRSNELAASWFEGIYPLDLIFHLPEDIYAQPEKYYSVFQEIESQLSNLDEVVAVHSPVVFFTSLFPEGSASDDSQLNAALSGRYNKEIRNNPFLNNYLTADGMYYRISLRTSWMNNEQTNQFIEKLRKEIDPEVSKSGLNYYITGLACMYINLNERLLRNKISSFIMSFSLIFIILLILFKDIRLAILGMIPNIAPVITTLGLMGWIGISLDIATILIAAISLGIAVDDTIHFLTTFRDYSRVIPVKERIQMSFEGVGRPIILTSILLICGFLSMIFSSYIPFIYFGVFLSLNIFFALVYDLLLLPAIIYVTQKRAD